MQGSSNHVTVAEIQASEILQRMTDSDQSLYAILDACDEPKVPAFDKVLGDSSVSLYKGTAQEELWSIAPYLINVDEKSFEWIREELFGTPWGIFVFAETNLETLRKHFRRFLIVKGPEGNDLYFRYYDPRVLPTFLTSCDKQEAMRFFGPIQSFVTEQELLQEYALS